MISRRAVAFGFASLVATSLAALIPAEAWAQSGSAKSAVGKLDTDNDGMVDLAEAKKAAAAAFERLDRDKDGTLDRRELRGRLSASELAVADPDKDGTLTKDEYFAVVEQRFKAADSDNDGKLDAKELRTKAGRALMHLLN